MEMNGIGGAGKVDVGGAIAMKVLKDQLKSQTQMIAILTQPTLVYDANGGVHSVPPKVSFDMQM